MHTPPARHHLDGLTEAGRTHTSAPTARPGSACAAGSAPAGRPAYRLPHREDRRAGGRRRPGALARPGQRCLIPAFLNLRRKIKRHYGAITAAIAEQLSNGLIEATNTNTRLIIRRGFGFRTADAIIALVMLCLGGNRPTNPLSMCCTKVSSVAPVAQSLAQRRSRERRWYTAEAWRRHVSAGRDLIAQQHTAEHRIGVLARTGRRGTSPTARAKCPRPGRQRHWQRRRARRRRGRRGPRPQRGSGRIGRAVHAASHRPWRAPPERLG
ncbi:transposase [Kitasatospora sp. NPDC001660]